MIDFTKFDHLRKAAKENKDIAYLLEFINDSIYVYLGEIEIRLEKDRHEELETILMAAEFHLHDCSVHQDDTECL